MKKILLVRSHIEAVTSSQHPANYRPPYTLKYIQALLKEKEDFSVRFIDACVQPLSLSKLSDLTFDFNPDVLVISSTPLDIKATVDYITIVKKERPAVIIIVIGPGPSSLPDVYDQNGMIDFILPGESELEVHSILRRINWQEDLKSIKKYYEGYKKRDHFIVQDLDGLPFINYTRNEIAQYSMIYPLRINKHLRWGHILSSRGCPYSCIFCSPLMRDSYGKQLRLRSAKNVIDEVMYQFSMGVNIVSFDDDNFTSSRDHVLSVCYEILNRKINFPWIVHARVDNLDREMMELIKKTGCRLLRIGVESGSTRILELLRKTNELNWIEKAKNIFNIARSLKIETAALFIVGNPTEDKEEILQSIELAKNLRPDIIQVSFFTPFAGSIVYRENKYDFDTKELGKIHHYSRTRLVNLSRLENGNLVEMHKTFYRSYLLDPKFIVKHFFRYLGFYLFNLGIFFRLFNIRKFLKKGGIQ